LAKSPRESFPKRCPSCGRPRRFISFIKLSHSQELSFVFLPVVDRRFHRAGPLFAECQACHESWVWVPDASEWIDSRQVQKGARRKATTSEEEDNRIGKVY